MSGPGLTQDRYPTGRLTIEGASGWVSMHTPAWNCTNLRSLWVRGPKRGQNRLLPTVAGVIPYRRRGTQRSVLLPLSICGDCNVAGVPYADAEAGLEANLKALEDAIVADPATTAGTRSARLTMPSGVDRSAAIHVIEIEDGPTLEGTNNLSGAAGVVMLATLSIEIPAGRFV